MRTRKAFSKVNRNSKRKVWLLYELSNFGLLDKKSILAKSSDFLLRHPNLSREDLYMFSDLLKSLENEKTSVFFNFIYRDFVENAEEERKKNTKENDSG